MSGYQSCDCRDCFEIAIGGDAPSEPVLCDPSEECLATHAYCSGGETSEGLCEDCGQVF